MGTNSVCSNIDRLMCIFDSKRLLSGRPAMLLGRFFKYHHENDGGCRCCRQRGIVTGHPASASKDLVGWGN
jgi:hypothetical protein